jgi:hypothetical protein
MEKSVTIKLVEPIIAHQGAVREITVKAPGLPLYQQYGNPYEFLPTDDGKSVYVENDRAIEAYMKACVVPPDDDPLLLDQVGLQDAIALREAILGFFVAARLAIASRTSRTS